MRKMDTSPFSVQTSFNNQRKVMGGRLWDERERLWEGGYGLWDEGEVM